MHLQFGSLKGDGCPLVWCFTMITMYCIIVEQYFLFLFSKTQQQQCFQRKQKSLPLTHMQWMSYKSGTITYRVTWQMDWSRGLQTSNLFMYSLLIEFVNGLGLWAYIQPTNSLMYSLLIKLIHFRLEREVGVIQILDKF